MYCGELQPFFEKRSALRVKPESIRLDLQGVEERRFENCYAAVLHYYKENGNMNVPVTYVDDNGIALGRWLKKYAQEKQRQSLPICKKIILSDWRKLELYPTEHEIYLRGNVMKPFDKKVWLATPTMHGDEMKYVQQA